MINWQKPIVDHLGRPARWLGTIDRTKGDNLNFVVATVDGDVEVIGAYSILGTKKDGSHPLRNK